MRSCLLAILMMCCLNIAHAYEMHGTLTDNNDGTFEVNIKSSTGESYWGRANLQGDGILAVDVAIQGRGSEVYLGTAKRNVNGTYDLYLKNNTTGKMATGILEKSF